jgi:hypothetical protein
VITRLTTQWQTETRTFAERDLSDRDYVYVWLVVVGGAASTAPRSWSRSPMATGSRPSHGRICSATSNGAGMGAPVLALGDGALGLWGALADVFPDTRRIWSPSSAPEPRSRSG